MIRLRCLAFLAVFFCAALAHAQTVIENDYTPRTEIVPERPGFVPGETAWFAVRQELRPGWHVFWINPGDAGLPLSLDWSLPEGFAAGAPLHPVPDYIPVGPLASYAHEGAPVFLVPVTAPADARPGEMLEIEIEAAWQACEEICVPEKGRFSFSLPVVEAVAPDASHAELFAAARAALPEEGDRGAGFSIENGDYVLTATTPEGFEAGEAFFFPEPEGLVEASAEQGITVEGGDARIAMTPGWRDGYEGPALQGVLAFETQTGRRGVRITAPLATAIVKPQGGAAPSSPQAASGAIGLPALLALAFFGGVLLNIMPCVFPVVFIKAAAFMESAREHPAAARLHGLLYAGGVLASFLLIASVLLVLRAGGEELGWGFHLQSPVVTALSAYVLLAVGLNLSGVFAVGESVAGAGQGLASKKGALGAFFTGVLAVVVAAPCIGPLMSAPMGAALLLPPAAGLAIFAALGLGLAAPYLVLSFAPGLGRRLPRPGPWMAAFKQLLAFPVFAAAAYFVWVLAQQAPATGLALVLAGAVLIAFAAWSFEKSKSEGRGAFVLRILSAVAVLLALAPLARIEAAAASSIKEAGAYGAMTAVPYDEAALSRYRAEGRAVFIDFTAAWCVTCQFNKLTVFSDRAVAVAFEDADAVFMVADWTVRDPEITEALARFGASGVPLYVYYPADGDPRVLALPLGKKAVIDAVSGS